MIKIVIADPHPIIYKGVKSFFRNSTEISVIGKTINFLELLNFLESKKIDIVLLEMDLPGLDGLQVIKPLKERFHYVNFLIFSSLSEEVYAISALKSGASGYLCKTNPLKELRSAILKISSGGIYITKKLAEIIAYNESNLNQKSKIDRLSEREVQVLKMLVDGKRNKEVAFSLGINAKTVSTYRSRIMKKLEAKNFVDLFQKTKHMDLEIY